MKYIFIKIHVNITINFYFIVLYVVKSILIFFVLHVF